MVAAVSLTHARLSRQGGSKEEGKGGERELESTLTSGTGRLKSVTVVPVAAESKLSSVV
jgi:hypothetical protein